MRIEIRMADEHPDSRDRREYGITGTDNAAILFIDSEAVAWTDDYCTAHLIGGTNATPTQDSVEAFMQQATDFYKLGNKVRRTPNLPYAPTTTQP